jgi:predicted AAA+ superfamily ATPase
MKRKISGDLVTWKNSSSRKPLVLRGARQVGKTYILKAFGRQEFQKLHYINFEEDDRIEELFLKDLRPARILDELQFYLNSSIDRTKDLLVLDEIQRCPRALTSLKYFCEEMPELALCAAGSLLGVHLNSESFPVGKVTFLDLFPMSFEEFLEGTGQDRLAGLLASQPFSAPVPEIAHEQLWEQWKLYLAVGGLPEAVKTYGEQQENRYTALQAVRKIQRDLFDAYLADIAKHSGKTNALHVERLWKNVPVQLARNQDGSAPKFRFRDSIPGLRGYEQISGPLSWLERAELVLRTSIVDAADRPLAGHAQENQFKLYFMDSGLLGAVSGISPSVLLQYGFGSYQGYVAENFVAQELKAAGHRELYCWQGRTSEIEFLIERPEGSVPVEVKSGRVTHAKSLSVYIERYHPVQAYVLSARNIASQNSRTGLPLYMAGRLARELKKEIF